MIDTHTPLWWSPWVAGSKQVFGNLAPLEVHFQEGRGAGAKSSGFLLIHWGNMSTFWGLHQVLRLGLLTEQPPPLMTTGEQPMRVSFWKLPPTLPHPAVSTTG